MGIMDTLPSQSNFFTTYFPFRSTTTNTLLRPSSLFNLRKPRPSSSSFLSLSSASPPPRGSTGFHTNTSDNNNPDPNNPICWAAFLGILTHTVKKSVAFFSLDDQEEYYGGKCFLQIGIGIGIGAGGVALLTATTTALALNNNKALKFIISPFVATLAANPTFVSGLLAWFAAQSMKVLLHFFFEKRWELRFYLASGGMPSSHSALCTALTTSVALCHGVADSLFPVCLGFTSIVMYDAIGVRRHAGMQAEVLNMIVEDLFQGHPISQRKLKELLGHTPSQTGQEGHSKDNLDSKASEFGI